MEQETGLEPATATLATWGSTAELLLPIRYAQDKLLIGKVADDIVFVKKLLSD